MFYVYVLRSEKDGNYYIGQTNDLDGRVQRHHAGYVKSTRNRLPLKLLYFEEFVTRKQAMRFEKYLKSGVGHNYIEQKVGRHGP